MTLVHIMTNNFQFNDSLLYNDPVDGLKRIEKIYIGIMAASASKSTYLYFLLVNEFKHDDDYENQNMNYAEWIEDGYNKIPQVKSNASKKDIKITNWS